MRQIQDGFGTRSAKRKRVRSFLEDNEAIGT
jgi:hypothetical protein